MPNLRKAIIKLAHENPGELREALLPLLRKQAGPLERVMDEAEAWVQQGFTLLRTLHAPSLYADKRLLKDIKNNLLEFDEWVSGD